jgi:signal transduction histidine kinase/AmiR/NasT family two-component response regulator
MIAFIAVTVAGIGLQLEEQSERGEAVAANTLTRDANVVLADAVNAETGVRGYAGTGDALFLAPYADAIGRVASDLRALRLAVALDAQRDQVEAITATSAAVFAQLDALRNGVHPGGGAATQDVSHALKAGKRIMDRLRAEVAALAGEPTKLLARKSAEINHLQKVIATVEVSGLIVGVLAGLAGVALFTSGISRRVQVAAANAGRLGEGAPLLPTKVSDDELGRLGGSLTRAEELLASRLEELSAARDQALLATETKNTFLSRTSHELRTPLNAILGFAQLLQLSPLDDDDRDSADRILSAGRNLLVLINELIDTARVESGELGLSIEPVGVGELVDEVADLIRPLAAGRNITVECSHSDRLLAARADKQRLRQVMVNLASNAVKYNRHGGTITIGYRLNGEDEIYLTVTDTGPGLTPNDIERIFVPFERLEAEQHGIEGTGIGLPLALALTEAMHGILEVASTPGNGSTFTVRLPRAELAPDDIDSVAVDIVVCRPVGVPPVGPLTVVSIEDNVANALLLERLFRDWTGATVYAATSAQAGIALALEHEPDVILLDLHLPDLPGEEAFARLQAEAATREIPVIVLSADATPGTVRRLLARGVSGYLTKPVDLRELHVLINRTVTDRRATTALRGTVTNLSSS